MTFDRILRDALEAAGFRGNGSQQRFRLYLRDHYGVEVSDSTVSAWLSGERSPSTHHLVAVMDALVVPMAERGRWIGAAVGKVDPSHVPGPAVNADGIVAVPDDHPGERGLDGPPACDERGLDVVDDVDLTVKTFTLDTSAG